MSIYLEKGKGFLEEHLPGFLSNLLGLQGDTTAAYPPALPQPEIPLKPNQIFDYLVFNPDLPADGTCDTIPMHPVEPSDPKPTESNPGYNPTLIAKAIELRPTIKNRGSKELLMSFVKDSSLSPEELVQAIREAQDVQLLTAIGEIALVDYVINPEHWTAGQK